MKVFFFLLSIFSFSLLFAQLEDSIQYKKSDLWISMKPDSSFFPQNWYGGSVNAQFELLDSNEYQRSYAICQRSIDKYDPIVLKSLRRVYVLKEIRFFDQSYGGTYASLKQAIYLSNKGISNNYTDRYIERVFHAEFSSILLEVYAHLFDEQKWTALNPTEFNYGNGGVNALKTGKSGETFSDTLSQMGFLTEYGTSSLENDFNSYAKQLFCPKRGTVEMLEKYPMVQKKWNLVIQFYAAIAPKMNAAHFANFYQKDPSSK